LKKSPKLILILLFLLLLVSARFSIAQHRCSTMEAERLRIKDRQLLPGGEKFERWLQKKLEEERSKLVPFGTNEDEDPALIPVVVHVIHFGEAYGIGRNIIDEQIFSQIEVLNEDFQRLNADTVHTQEEFIPIASKLNIEFVMARQDELGQATTGIVRVQGEKEAYNPLSISDRELLSSYSQWDPNIYLNIWVTNLTGDNIGLAQFPDYGESQGGLPGLDEQPNKDNEATDGMVVDYQAFGSVAKVPGLELKPKYNLGRTATHELGHYLGLLHVWGDDTSINGCNVDDFVEDTPNSRNTYSGNCKPSTHESCGSNDMFENYMYYTDDACMNIFTEEQVGRMQLVLANAVRRTSLLNSPGTEFPDELSFDLAIAGVVSPGKAMCDDAILPSIEIRNNGGTAVANFDVLLSVNGSDFNYTYTGDSIRTGETIELVFDEFVLEQGTSRLRFELLNIPEDLNPVNNVAMHVFAIDGQQDFIPLREQFAVESLDLTNWISINEDEDIGWEVSDLEYDSRSNAALINLYNYEERNQMDWLISPVLDFSDAREASLSFRVSYAQNNGFNDQLQVLISENCEGYFNTVLETYNSIDLSVRSSDDFWEPDSRNDWNEFSLDLSSYAGQKDLRLAFKSINGYGNNLYIDDIEFFTVADENRVGSAQNSFTLYPNPADDGRFQLAFNTSGRQLVTIYIFDQLGKEVSIQQYPNTLNQTYYYDFAGKSPGVYYIHAKGEDFVRSKKLLLTR